MTDIDSNDYHDFVIRNGRLIGEFEQMYRKSAEVPWHQDRQTDWIDVKIATEMLTAHAPFDVINEFGCGLGYFLDVLCTHLGAPGCVGTGYDVSQSSCESAAGLFPAYQFHPFCLMSDTFAPRSPHRAAPLTAIRGTLWYVYPGIDQVLRNLSKATRPGGLLLVSQNFPPLDTPFVGKEIFPDPDAMISRFGTHFTPVQTVWLQNHISAGNDNWLIGLFRRRRQ